MDENRDIINIRYLRTKTTLVPEVTSGASVVDAILSDVFDDYAILNELIQPTLPPVDHLSKKAKEELIQYIDMNLMSIEITQYINDPSKEDDEDDSYLARLILYNCSFDYLSNIGEDVLEANSETYRFEITEDMFKDLFNLLVSSRSEFVYEVFDLEKHKSLVDKVEEEEND